MKQRFHQSRVVPLSLGTGRRSKFIAPQEIMKVYDHSSFRPKSQCCADINSLHINHVATLSKKHWKLDTQLPKRSNHGWLTG